MARTYRNEKKLITLIAILVFITAGIGYLKSRLKGSKTADSNNAAAPINLPKAELSDEEQKNLKSYTNSEAGFKFSYPLKLKDCPNEVSLNELALNNEGANLINISCEKDINLVQIIYEKTDTDLLNWWYSLLDENKSFFAKYGTKENISFAGNNAIQISYRKGENNDHFYQAEILTKNNGHNLLIVALNYFCAENPSSAPCWQGETEHQILSSFSFISPTGEAIKNEVFCGGIMGKLCPSGFTCKLEGDYPDAGGKCVKNE